MSVIYGLCDPRLPLCTENVRYVGKTIMPLEYRLRKHLETARRGDRTYRGRWVRSVLDAGENLAIIVLEAEPADLDEAECRWILDLRERGCRLTNGTAGGSGGNTLDTEARAARSAAMKARWADPEYRERMSQAHVGKTLSPESRRKVAEGARAAWADPTTKRSEGQVAQRGTKKRSHPPLTPEQRQSISNGLRRGWETRRRNVA